MPRTTLPKHRRATIALLVVPLACLGLGACGSSGGSSSSASTPASTHTTAEAPATTAATTPPASTTPTTPTATTPASTTPTTTSTEPSITTARQFSEVYECLRHNGIALPPLKSVKSIGSLKVNTKTPQYQAALATCRHKVLG
jgi:hypothetical protein